MAASKYKSLYIYIYIHEIKKEIKMTIRKYIIFKKYFKKILELKLFNDISQIQSILVYLCRVKPSYVFFANFFKIFLPLIFFLRILLKLSTVVVLSVFSH